MLPQEHAPSLKNPSRNALSLEHKIFQRSIKCRDDTELTAQRSIDYRPFVHELLAATGRKKRAVNTALFKWSL